MKKKNRRLFLLMVLLVVVAGFAIWVFAFKSSKEVTTFSENSALSGIAEVLYEKKSRPPTSPEKVSMQPRSNTGVVSVVAGLSNASTFQHLFTSTGIASVLVSKGPYTVFVPTDAGLTLAPKGSIRNMTFAEKKRFVEYHVVMGRMLELDALDSTQIQALSGDTLNFTVRPDTGFVQVNSAFALTAYKASNGVVYTINQPLFPPKK